MRVLAHGIDIVEVARIGTMIDRHADHFLRRCFTPAELDYARPRRRRVEHLAGRFAAKEAIFKALGTGWRSGIAWTDAEVVLLPSGQPQARLHGAAEAAARELGIREWLLSISHTETHAVASAIAVGESGD